MRPTLLPMKYKAGNKLHNVIFLWNESWAETDDFFFVMEKNSFKPYFRNKIYDINDNPIYPHYHYDGEFEKYLNEYVKGLPLTRVVMSGRAVYLMHNFGNEYWAFDPVNRQIVYAYSKPKISTVKYKRELVENSIYNFILEGITKRVKFSDSHLMHLEVIAPKR